MSTDEFSIDMEECELAYQKIVEQEAFDDVFEQYLERQEGSYWGNLEPDDAKIDDSSTYCLNDEVLVNAIGYQQLLHDRQRDQQTIQNLLQQVKMLKWVILGFGADYPPKTYDSFDDFTDLSPN